MFGTSTLSEKLEHDRAYAIGVAEEAGLQSPPTEEFSTVDEGLAFLDEHADTAYVFKPGDGNFTHLTFVPCLKDDADANREVSAYLGHLKEEPGSYILQERIPREDCIEVNVELWFYEGEPFLATLGLELTRKDTGDVGEMAGWAGDFMQVIPMDCPLVEQTIGRMTEFYRGENYTGTADVNVLLTKDGTPWFLEVCDRFGYNAHVTLLLGLLKGRLGDVLADFTDGRTDGIPAALHAGVAGSLTLFLDHPRPGLPLHVDDSVNAQWYPFDGYREYDTALLTGYSNEVGILVQRGATLEAASEALYRRLSEEAVSVPDSYWRTDLGESDYPASPVRRMTELKKRGLL